MFYSIILTFFVLRSQTAIIQSPINTQNPLNSFPTQITRLSRNFIYSLTTTSSGSVTTNGSIFFTLTANNQNCNALLCYYGWVNNYTVDDKKYDGYSLGSKDNQMVFMLKVFKNKTFAVTLNQKLKTSQSNVIDLCSKISNPLVVQISSLNPFNQSPKTSMNSVYSFFPFNQASKNLFIKNQMNLQEIQANSNANTTSIGLNKTSSSIYKSFLDVLAVDNSTNTLLNRKVDFILNKKQSQQGLMQLKLKSSSRFSNINPLINLLQSLSQNPQNTKNYQISPKNIQLSEFKLNLP